MLTKEIILKALGMTEEQIKEAKIDVDKLVKEAQTLGDNIKDKYVDETTKTLTEQHKKEIVELGKNIKKKTDLLEDDKIQKGLSSDDITKLITDGIAQAIEPLKAKETETTINSFKKNAFDKGYSEEQVNYFVSTTKQEALDGFNFDLFPLNKDGDDGKSPDDKDPKTKDQQLDDEFQKRMKNKK